MRDQPSPKVVRPRPRVVRRVICAEIDLRLQSGWVLATACQPNDLAFSGPERETIPAVFEFEGRRLGSGGRRRPMQ